MGLVNCDGNNGETGLRPPALVALLCVCVCVFPCLLSCICFPAGLRRRSQEPITSTGSTWPVSQEYNGMFTQNTMNSLLSGDLWHLAAPQMKIEAVSSVVGSHRTRLARSPISALLFTAHQHSSILSSLRSTLRSCTGTTHTHVVLFFIFWCKVTV